MNHLLSWTSDRIHCQTVHVSVGIWYGTIPYHNCTNDRPKNEDDMNFSFVRIFEKSTSTRSCQDDNLVTFL